MESELRELYQQVILDHHRKPRNHREVEGANRRAEGFNPLCGDHVTVQLKLAADGRCEDAGFTGSGCAICTASASMMTEAVRGKTREEAEALFQGFHRLVTGAEDAATAALTLGKLAVFAGVREFPVRVKCASLPWHTFHAAATGEDERITTE